MESKNKKKTRINFLTIKLVLKWTGILFLIIFVLTTFNKNQSTSLDSEVRAELRNEFENAYNEDISKTGKIVEYDLVADESNIEIFDGFKTKVWAYNNTVPGPEFRITLGDMLRVNFKNSLPQETTIHWHGVRVPNAMDGVPGVTQDPILPDEEFTYEFIPKDAGTFWFHPHVNGSEQVERGLYGTLIVEDENPKQYDQDIVWVLDDWRITKNYQVDPNFVTPRDLMHDGRWGSVITTNGKLDEILYTNPGERIRLRLVNTSNARIYTPSFGKLDAKIIAVDGMYVKEVFSASGFELSPGNRIDIDIKVPVTMSNKTVNITDYFTGYSNTLGKIIIGNEVKTMPEFQYPINKNIPDWNDYSKVETDQLLILNTKMGMGMMNGIEWTINNKFYPDYDPINLKYNEFNKITFRNDSYRLHPMHLHGQFFKVLSRNGVAVDEPYFRETVLIHSRETIEIGLVPLDKGLWVSHCHILEHADAGMLTVVRVE